MKDKNETTPRWQLAARQRLQAASGEGAETPLEMWAEKTGHGPASPGIIGDDAMNTIANEVAA